MGNHNLINNLISELAQEKGSDLHITAKKKNYLRIKKIMTPSKQQIILTNDDIVAWLQSTQTNTGISNEAINKLISGEKDIDFSIAFNIIRMRGHAYCVSGSLSIAFRKINEHIPTISDLKLPTFYQSISDFTQGLVLITGATGSGKSTTIASIIDTINSRHQKHILTLEEPIEYVFNDKLSKVSQREVGKDVASFSDGIKSALREDPDVILLGEIRDAEEVKNALKLSSSGHIVFATLHTSGILHTIGRITSLFKGDEEKMIRGLLQDNLKCIINQVLYKSDQNEMFPLLEHLFIDKRTVRILNGDMPDNQIKQILETESKDKSRVMFRWQTIIQYCNQKILEVNEAKRLIELYDPDKLANFEAQISR